MKPLLSSVSFLIPAYNDESTVERAIKEAREVGRDVACEFEIRVINDRSPDATGKVLERLARTIPELVIRTHETNLGYGGTVKELYYSGTKDWLFTIPGDYQIGAKELHKLVPAAKDNDLVLGWRTDRHDPPARLRQSRIYNRLVRLLFGVRVHDVNSVRLMRREMMKRLTLTTTSAFVDAELIIRAMQGKFRITEVPIVHMSRHVGEESAGGGKLRTILPTIRDMGRFFLLGF